jgi:hypothetical protein
MDRKTKGISVVREAADALIGARGCLVPASRGDCRKSTPTQYRKQWSTGRVIEFSESADGIANREVADEEHEGGGKPHVLLLPEPTSVGCNCSFAEQLEASLNFEHRREKWPLLSQLPNA